MRDPARPAAGFGAEPLPARFIVQIAPPPPMDQQPAAQASEAAAAIERAGAEADIDVTRLGLKGAGLVRMARLGLPVPPGFVLTTDLWRYFAAHGGVPDRLPEPVWQSIRAAVAELSAQVAASGTGGRAPRLGDPDQPLLLSVRSGAAVSMPGMMDSLLNIGVCEATLAGVATRGGRRFALDCYQRLIRQYGQVVLGRGADGDGGDFGGEPLDTLRFELRQRRGVLSDEELTEAELAELCAAMQAELARRTGAGVPQDCEAQLHAAIVAVLRSHDGPRARDFRRSQRLPDDLGTAITVQLMVLGNRPAEPNAASGTDAGSCTGVAFTRDPSTGEARLYGEYLEGAQGEDVVSGRITPRPLAEMATRMPHAYAALEAAARKLERHLGDMQDVEFTVEAGQLYLLQTRPGKRSARAMVRIAVEQVREGGLTPTQALARVDAARLAELLVPTLDLTPGAGAGKDAPVPLTRGLPASPGVATGRVSLTVADALARVRRGEKVILVRSETSSEDIAGVRVAQGVLTARGGLTSHAAVVARGLGRCAVVGASAIQIDGARQQFTVRERTRGLRALPGFEPLPSLELEPLEPKVVRAGDLITLDGASGAVFQGPVPLRAPQVRGETELAQLLAWADAIRRVRIHARLEDEHDLGLSRELGVDGVLRSRGDAIDLDGQAGALIALADPLPDAEQAARLAQSLLIAVEVTDADSGSAAATAEAKLAAARAASPEAQVGLLDRSSTGLSPAWVEMAERLGLAFVACAPLRTPIARIVAAQTAARIRGLGFGR